MKTIPSKFEHAEIEQRWAKFWQESGVYNYQADKSREETFVVDTPPPTVSGSLHVGHVFSYTHTDLIVRYQRMLGKNIMYPMGWDDNGLATERRVQNKLGILCNPNLSYDPTYSATDNPSGKRVEVSRRNFVEACAKVTQEDEQAFETLWRNLGLSLDWTQTYATIDGHCRKISQLSFLDLVEKGLVYNAEAPTMWDVTFKSAVAQADLEDRETSGFFHDVAFGIEGGGEFVITTSRPELIVACLAVVAHPDDERYKHLFGKFAITPLFNIRVPIIPSTHADPEKGSGIMMTSTFGDSADVEWWKSSGLPIRQVLNLDGRFKPLNFSTLEEAGLFASNNPAKAERYYQRLLGKSTIQGRKEVALMLAEAGSAADNEGVALRGELKPIKHAVKYYEKGEQPIEFVTTRQWFIKLLAHREELLALGDKVKWHPAHMQTRYTHWVQGLNHDWCISRQRFFGVPFPVWYKVDAQGELDYNSPIFAKPEQLPVDPYVDCPVDYTEEQRNQPGGFSGDKDVMDTWATSSLTPQIASHWGLNPERHRKLFPMDMRPQSHEIIRTWAFYTMAKAWFHEREIPWKNVVISGWILDPDRKKMSKSVGNVITPQHLLEQYSSDAVRYWAARARLGVDTAFDEKVFSLGRKLCNKVFNASRFVLTHVDEVSAGQELSLAQITAEVDRALIAELKTVVQSATEQLAAFEYAAALQTIEGFFWKFCDNYLELVKARAYDKTEPNAQLSAVATLKLSLSVVLRLMAPYLPYVTEEVWSWRFADETKTRSIHTSKWPSLEEFAQVSAPEKASLLEVAAKVLSEIHHAKSKAQKTLKWPVSGLKIQAQSAVLETLALAEADLRRAGRVQSIEYIPTDSELSAQVSLAEEYLES